MPRSRKTKIASESPRGDGARVPEVELLEAEVLPAEEVSDSPDSANEDSTADGPISELAETAATVTDLPIEATPSEPADAELPIPRDRRSLAASVDALSAYLREIGRHPPLTREQEHALALQYTERKDMQAAYKLVVSNLWLVVKIAREYEQAARNLLDLVQEGNIGLLEAVKNFDPYRGVRFPSYAVWWVRAYIIRYLIANWRMVKIGTTQAQRKLFFNLKKEKEKLEREGFAPVPKLLAQRLNVKEGEIIEMEQRLGAGSEVSVDAPLQDDSESSMHQLLASDAPNAEQFLARKEFQEQLLASFDEFEKSLNPKEKVIFRQRMLGEEKATLQEISDQIAVSRERVRQLENRIREKLKEFMTSRLGVAGEGEFSADE